MTDRYAVFGNPIAHSRSPRIHTLFAEQTGQDLVYERQCVEPGEFDAAADAFFNGGGKGLNVTVPFKLDAFAWAGGLTPRARRAGAVNTLALQADASVLGDNTDGVGMVRDLTTNLGWGLAAARVLILGAGGAVRGVLEPLLAANPAAVVIANRTVSKAENLAADFADLGRVQGCGFGDLEGQFDLVLNGTSASLAGDLPPLSEHLVAPTSCCYDMMYGAEPTVFMAWARRAGAGAAADGLGMLVEQAAESFCLWRGVSPRTAEVISTLRRELMAARS